MRTLVALSLGLLLSLSFACATTNSSPVDRSKAVDLNSEDSSVADPSIHPATAEEQPVPGDKKPSDAKTPDDGTTAATGQAAAEQAADQGPATAEGAAPEAAKQAGEDAVAEPQQEILKISNNPTARKDFKEALAFSSADPARAMALFERSAREDGTFVLAWHNAGSAAELQRKWPQAQRYYQKALEHQADFFPSLYGLVQVLVQQGRAAEARTAMQRALAAKRNQKTLAAAGVAALAAGRLGEAEQYAKQSLKQDEKFVPAMQLLADVYFRQKKYELSRFVLRNASEIEPDNALVHQALARANLKLDNKSVATKEFERAVSLRTDLVEANNNLSVLYYESGDFEAALRVSKASVDQAPDSAIAWLNYGNALRANKQYASAIAAYEKARGLKNAPAAAEFNLGILYIDNPVDKLDIVQRMDKALAYLESYRGRVQLDEEQVERLDKFVTEAQRAKKREIKKRERAAKRKARDEARKKAAEEEKRKAEEEARLKEEARVKAEQEAARKKAEDAARKKAAEEARLKAEQEARTRSLGAGGK